jgi:hypothetical protein
LLIFVEPSQPFKKVNLTLWRSELPLVNLTG